MKLNETANQWELAIRFGFLSLLILGFFYPLAVTGLTSSFFPFKANGSLLVEKGRVVGSELLAQNITSKAMFRYRPSAASYGTLPSGASNLSPSSLDLKKLIEERILDLEAAGISKDECNELLYTSGSGLDPHITPICAYEQAKVLAKEGKVPLDQINELILKHTEYPLLGFVGRERINVTKLNLSWRQIIHE